MPSLALARVCSTAALCHEDIISDLPPVFDSIPELCNSSGPSILTKLVPIAKLTSSVKLGPFSSNSVPPLGSIPWNRPRFIPPELMHLRDPLSPWFSALDKFSPIVGGVPTPATIFPLLWEDHVNNHISLGVPPPEHKYANPVSSRGPPSQIRRYRALHPGQLSARSSRGLVLTPNQLSVRSSW